MFFTRNRLLFDNCLVIQYEFGTPMKSEMSLTSIRNIRLVSFKKIPKVFSTCVFENKCDWINGRGGFCISHDMIWRMILLFFWQADEYLNTARVAVGKHLSRKKWLNENVCEESV